MGFGASAAPKSRHAALEPWQDPLPLHEPRLAAPGHPATRQLAARPHGVRLNPLVGERSHRLDKSAGAFSNDHGLSFPSPRTLSRHGPPPHASSAHRPSDRCAMQLRLCHCARRRRIGCFCAGPRRSDARRRRLSASGREELKARLAPLRGGHLKIDVASPADLAASTIDGTRASSWSSRSDSRRHKASYRARLGMRRRLPRFACWFRAKTSMRWRRRSQERSVTDACRPCSSSSRWNGSST